MIVTVKPPGREEYILSTTAEPRFSSSLDGFGYDAAQIDCEWDRDKYTDALGGRLRIYGETGIVWQGIVKRRPSDGEPLLAKGWGWCGTLGRRAVVYCDTRTSALGEYNGTNYAAFTRSITGGIIEIGQSPGTDCDTGDNAGYYYWEPGSTIGKVTFDLIVNHPDVLAGVWRSASEGALSSGGTAYTTTQSVEFDCGGASGFVVRCYVEVDSSIPSRWDKYIRISNLKVWDSAITSTPLEAHTGVVVRDILTDEIDTGFLPSGDAYLAWIDAEETPVEPLVFESCDANEKFSELAKCTTCNLTWSVELVGGLPYCVPHWTPRSTTPDYILKTSECESVDLDEAALDELASVARVHYETTEGRATYTDVTDTEDAHPLVALGITRYADIHAQTASSATAAAIGAIAVAEMGRAKVKGTVTTRRLYTATGTDAYLPDVRPGEMVRVMGLPQGYVDCTVLRVECVGGAIATLTLDNDGYRLDIMLARLEKRE